jgi:hypothetical protein
MRNATRGGKEVKENQEKSRMILRKVCGSWMGRKTCVVRFFQLPVADTFFR